MLAAFCKLILVPLVSFFPATAGDQQPASPVLDTNPGALTICAGARGAMRCKAIGDDLVYRWQIEAAPRVWVDVEIDPEPHPLSRFLVAENPDGSSSLLFGGLGLNESKRFRCLIETRVVASTRERLGRLR